MSISLTTSSDFGSNLALPSHSGVTPSCRCIATAAPLRSPGLLALQMAPMFLQQIGGRWGHPLDILRCLLCLLHCLGFVLDAEPREEATYGVGRGLFAGVVGLGLFRQFVDERAVVPAPQIPRAFVGVWTAATLRRLVCAASVA